MLRNIVPAIYLALLIAYCILRTAHCTAQQYNFSWYTIENGLPQSQVYALLQDSKGYLWIGTYGGGLCRFDGTNFVIFTSKDGLGNDRIYSIMEDSKGNIWIGMDSGGLGKYKGSSSGSSGEEKNDDVNRDAQIGRLYFINYTVKDGLNSNIILKIIEDHKGVLWLATTKGICTYNGKEFTNFSKKNNLEESQVWAVMQDKNNNIWFGVKSSLFRYNYPDTLPDKRRPNWASVHSKGKAQTWQAGEAGKNIETFTTQQGLEHRFICALLEDNKGSIWMGDYYTGVSYYNGKNFEHYSVADGLAGNMVLTIIEDEVGNLWFGCNGGVSKYDRAGTSDLKSGVGFKNYREENGLSGNSVRSLLEDNEGNIWIGTSGSGLCKFSGDAFTHYYEKDGIINHKVSSFTEDQDGNIWFATEGGLSKLSSSLTFTNYTTNEGLPVNVVTVLLKDRKGNIWIGTPAGLCKYDPKKEFNELTIFTRDDGMITNRIISIDEDSEGCLWIGTNGGVSKLVLGDSEGSPPMFTNFTLNDGLVQRYINDILVDSKGNVWMASYGGINKYDGKTMKGFTKKDNLGLEGTIVTTIQEDNEGNVWFGVLGGGVSKYNDERKDGKYFQTIMQADGLSSNSVISMVIDEVGYLWAGTNKGIDRFNINKFNTTGEIEIKHYGKLEGFTGIECNSIFSDTKGNLWFGTVKGITKFDPRKDKINTNQPKTHITRIRLFLKDFNYLNFSDSIHANTGLPFNLKLPYYKNHLTFNFVGISLTIPEKVKYQYKLEGMDNAWSPPGKEHIATYSNIPPGKYTIKVKACNNDGVWNKEPTTFSFIVKPPYWETGWFYSAQLLFFMLLIGGTLLARRRGVKDRTVTILVYICLFMIFEFIQNLCEPLYEEYVGSAPIIKTFLNLILASTLLPVQLFLRKYLRGKEKKQGGVEDGLV
ncbi:MAG: hypothetical protein FVQ77_00785 [Cytophagales bacterium]|nr:hypothetical protein [Cytophagales bacterium]